MKKIVLVMVGFLTLISSSVFAQTESSWVDNLVGKIKQHSYAEIESRYIFESDIDATGAEISVVETSFNYEYEFKLFGEMPIEVDFDYLHTDIDENDPVDLPSHLEAYSMTFDAKMPLPFTSNPNYFMGIEVTPTMNTDDGKFESSAFRIPFRVYGIYRETDDFIFVLGAAIRPEYNREIVPIIGFRYRPCDKVYMDFATDDPTITYEVSEDTDLVWEFGYRLDEYEVTRNGQEGVVLENTQASTGLGVNHRFTENLRGYASVGVAFARGLEYADSNGKVDSDPGLYAMLRISGEF